MICGNNFQHTGQWDAAEKHYWLAHYMVPNRFMPFNYLMDIYCSKGDSAKARQIAHLIINKPIKVPSASVYSIISKAHEVLKYESYNK